MAARSKKRAKFRFNDRDFRWYIDADTWLRIYSAEKNFIVAYLLYHPDLTVNSAMYIEIIGNEFPPRTSEARPLGLVVPTSVANEIQNSMGALVNAILNWAFDSTTEVEYHPLSQQFASTT
ncbi:MAG: hypothetical protein ABJZ55_18880 [Fuerstiella sp.]